MNVIKSPIYYTGNKTKLLNQIVPLLPKKIKTFYDLFSGSSVVSMNVEAERYLLNDTASNIQNILKIFSKYSAEEIHDHILKRINQFNLSKTGKEEFNEFRNYLNEKAEGENIFLLDCFTISFYSFSNMMRWSSKDLKFNVPFGHREYKFNNSFGKSEYDQKKSNLHFEKISNAVEFLKSNCVEITMENTFELIKKIKFKKNDFVYLDPPYFGTNAVYNSKTGMSDGWNAKEEHLLLSLLENLQKQGVKFAMSNVLENKGHKNIHLEFYCLRHKWKIHYLNRTYAANGHGNAKTKEILITNY